MTEVINNQTFHDWKQHDCTKALINLIKDSIEIDETSIMVHVKSNEIINTDVLNCYKGGLKNLHEILMSIQDKLKLELYLNDKEVENASKE